MAVVCHQRNVEPLDRAPTCIPNMRSDLDSNFNDACVEGCETRICVDHASAGPWLLILNNNCCRYNVNFE